MKQHLYVAFAFASTAVASIVFAPQALAGCRDQDPATPGWHDHSVFSEGQTRRYKLFVPKSYSGDEVVPLVIDLQASGITPDVEVQITGMANAAEQHGFIVAAPKATYPFPRGGKTWNIPRNPDVPSDVVFIDQLVQQVEERFCLDHEKVFAVGYSGGARLASEVACRRPDLVDGIAVVGGLRHPEIGCRTDGPPVQVIAFHSAADPINPYDLSEFAPAYWGYGVETALRRWVSTNGCEGESLNEAVASASKHLWADCRSDSRIEFYRLEEAGHVWPGSTFAFPDYVGQPETELPATALILEFFGLAPR